MKILVIPDIHLKPWLIHEAALAMDSGKYDKAVFLGDFVDDHKHWKDILLYKETLNCICDFIKKYPSLICWGNHEMSYVWNEIETGWSPFAKEVVVDNLKRIASLLSDDDCAYMHRIDNVIFSHAGLTIDFARRHFLNRGITDLDEIIGKVNQMSMGPLWWEEDSPLWARALHNAYTMYPDGYIQVVGHTPVYKTLYEEENNLLTVDNFSTFDSGFPLGDTKMIYIDTISKEWDVAFKKWNEPY